MGRQAPSLDSRPTLASLPDMADVPLDSQEDEDDVIFPAPEPSLNRDGHG
jgi:hypothetical protein